jgi:integrase
LSKLQQVIDATEPTGDLTFLVNSHGNPFTVKSLGYRFREWCDTAELPHCSMHGLRKAMLCYLAEPPMLCSTQEIMAISNHASIQDVETYVAKVRKDMLAEGVRQRLEDQNENRIP